MSTCRECGAALSGQEAFCPECRAAVPISYADEERRPGDETVHDEATQAGSLDRCPHCGAAASPEELVCPRCSALLEYVGRRGAGDPYQVAEEEAAQEASDALGTLPPLVRLARGLIDLVLFLKGRRPASAQRLLAMLLLPAAFALVAALGRLVGPLVRNSRFARLVGKWLFALDAGGPAREDRPTQEAGRRGWPWDQPWDG